MLRIVFALAMASPIYAAVSSAPFGETPAGEKVQIFTLSNTSGFEARIMTYGGIIVSLQAPDKNGKLGDVVHGFDSLDGYLGEHPYFGALIGRYGNRIARGRFTLDGRTYTLATNNDANHHGDLPIAPHRMHQLEALWHQPQPRTPRASPHTTPNANTPAHGYATANGAWRHRWRLDEFVEYGARALSNRTTHRASQPCAPTDARG